MTLLPGEKVEDARIVKRTIDPAPVPPELKDQQERGTYNWVVRIWHWVRGYSANDIGRLKEGALRRVEHENDVKAATAKKKLAKAELYHAQAEEQRQQAAIKRAKAHKIEAEADALRAQAFSEAVVRFAEAISRIRQQGGDVSFDMEQVEALIREGFKRFPNDPAIRDAVRQLQQKSDD